MPSQPPVYFALVGCGRIAAKHLEAVASTAGAKLVAVCDVDRARAESTGQKLNLPAFTRLESMLEATPKLDVVSILTPSGDHAASALTCLQAGRHVLIEKPMALTIDSAEEVILKADAVGRRVFVVKQNRYNAPVVKCREFMDQGHFGRLTLGTVRVRWCRKQEYYDQASWRGTWRMDGGVLANQASHHIDLLQWFMGEPERVYAVARTAMVDIETEDTAAAVIEFRGGGVGIVEATTATRPRDLEGSLSLLGEKGSVVIGGFAVNQLQTWSFEGRSDNADLLESLSYETDNVYGFGHKQVYANVCDSLRTGGAALVDGWEALKSLRLISALYESIETGKPIAMKFVPERCRLGR